MIHACLIDSDYNRTYLHHTYNRMKILAHVEHRLCSTMSCPINNFFSLDSVICGNLVHKFPIIINKLAV